MKRLSAQDMQRVALRLGWRVERATHELSRHRARLLAAMQTDLVIDVGAAEGQFATELRRRGYTGRMLSIEPRLESYKELARCAASARRPWDHLRAAIAEEPGRRALITTAQGHSSSFLPPRLDIDRNDIRTATGAEVVTCRRLDELGEVDGALAIHLKIDVQGMELDVYRSAGEMADRIVSLELELSLVELYEGQPLIEVVMDHLRRDGFAPVALTRGYTAPIDGRVFQVDGLFIREPTGRGARPTMLRPVSSPE